MILRILAVMIVILVSVMVPGCKKKAESTTVSEVKVTEENLDAELDKMEQQIEADIAAEE